MRVTCFFDDGYLVHQLVQFQATGDLPAPPVAFIFEHFRQAVLANMRGAGQAPDLDFDPSDDALGSGKNWFERESEGKLIPGIDDRIGVDDLVNH